MAVREPWSDPRPQFSGTPAFADASAPVGRDLRVPPGKGLSWASLRHSRPYTSLITGVNSLIIVEASKWPLDASRLDRAGNIARTLHVNWTGAGPTTYVPSRGAR